jgi:high affinity Mn2+ porin
MHVAELETRYSLFSRPGKLRLNGWLYNAYSGSFRETVDIVAADPSLNPNDVIVATRTGRIKYGYVVNLEQSLTDNLGLFGRWSWNSDKSEMSAFTDINASLSGGISIKGASWGRPQDVVGLAGAINGLAPDFRNYLAIGGLGILVGDGVLNYRTEKVLEAYYALFVAKGTTLSFDYQFIQDPAYNADRGRFRSSPAASVQPSDCKGDHPTTAPRHRLGAILIYGAL